MSQGVKFVPNGAPPNLPEIANATVAQSPPRVATLFNCQKEFCESEVRGNFLQNQRNRVKVYVGGAQGKYTLTALLNTGGSKAVNVQIDENDPAGVVTPLEVVASAGTKIKAFLLDGPGSFDNLTFDAPDPGQPPDPPDFTLERDFSGTIDPSGTVGIAVGKSASLKVVVTRFNSTGPIDFKLVEPLPSKVTATPTPQSPFVGGDGDSIAYTFTAQKNAPPAERTMTLLAEPRQGAGSDARSISFKLEVVGEYDLRVTGIEVTQAIQSEFQPCTSPDACDENVSLFPGAGGVAPYLGLPLVQEKKTVARVFANLRVPAFPDGTSFSGVDMKLYRADGSGKPIGNPLLPDAGAKTVFSGGPGNVPGGSGLPWVTFEERADPRAPFTFTLPDSWTEGNRLNLRAEIVPPLAFIGTTETECGTPECFTNNKFTLTGIPFYRTGYYDLATIRTHRGEAFDALPYQDSPRPDSLLGLAELWFPLADGELYYDKRFYDAAINVSEEAQCCDDARDRMYEVLDTVEDYADDHDGGCERGNLCSDVVLGVFDTYISNGGTSNSDFPGQTVVTMGRVPPGGSVAHELSHNFGREHSGTCPSSNGQGDGEDWPPDEKGFIQGIGLDTRAGSGPGGAPYATIAPGDYGAKDQMARYYDQQSYCHAEEGGGLPNDGDRWTSVLGWQKDLVALQFIAQVKCRIPGNSEIFAPAPLPFGGCPSSKPFAGAGTAQAPATALRVQGLVDTAGAVRIMNVKPTAAPLEQPPALSQYHLIVKNAAGEVVSDTPMKARLEKDELVTLLTAEAPAAGAASVEITRDGTVVAGRSRSANVPTVNLTAPKKGSRVRQGRKLKVRWQATDSDGDKLLAKVDYSDDDGRTWRPVYSGPNSGKADIPDALVSAARKARVRLRVQDGFNEGSAVSGRFTADGRPPSVTIKSPAPKQQVMNDSTVYLSGAASDDATRRLTGRSLRWSAGKRKLGSGGQISVTGLEPGRRRITLQAKDRHGRTAKTSVTVRVTASVPQFLRLDKPAKLSRRAKRVKLVVASAVRATLRAGKQSFDVGPRAKGVTVAIKPGKKQLRLSLQLRAGGKVKKVVLLIPRS